MTTRAQNLHKLLSLAALALAVTAGCGGELGDDFGAFGERSATLMNGRITGAHPAVGLLRMNGYICTATLVGSRTVLTAAHCVKPGAITFEVGGSVHQVANATPHPQYNKTQTSIVNDVAIMRLATTPAVLPVAVSSKPPYPGLGATLLGFGVTTTDGYDSGVKREGRRTISAVSQADIEFVGAANGTPNICSGDSGGPTFAPLGGGGSLVQVGVHSYGQANQCGVSEHDMRLDVHLQWLRSVAGGDLRVDDGTEATPPPGPQPPPPSNPPTTPDSTPPTVMIVSPQSGSNVANNVTVNITASDDRGALRMVQLLINGQHIANKATAPYNFQATLPDGDVVLTALALDLAGNQSTRSVTVKVGQSAPPSQPQPPYQPPPQPTQPPQPQPQPQYQQPTGCSVGAGDLSNAPLPLLLLALLAVARRRRRARD